MSLQILPQAVILQLTPAQNTAVATDDRGDEIIQIEISVNLSVMNRAQEIPEARLGLQSFRSGSSQFSRSFRLFDPRSATDHLA